MYIVTWSILYFVLRINPHVLFPELQEKSMKLFPEPVILNFQIREIWYSSLRVSTNMDNAADFDNQIAA